jgi:hypothetical protein
VWVKKFAAVYHRNELDANTLLDSVGTAQGNLQQANCNAAIKGAVADTATIKTRHSRSFELTNCEPNGSNCR